MKEAYSEFLSAVRDFIPEERIYTDELRRFAWGTDAGFYRLVPQIVIRSDNEREVSLLLAAASRLHIPVTFRAAGTSLSGQAISDSVLIVAGKHWEGYRIGENAETITLQPGVIGGHVNEILAPLGREFGPDPASLASSMVGGIVINNASGMSCGTHANSDKTLLSARIVFLDGTILDTGDPASRDSFRRSHPAFLRTLETLRDEITADPALSERIRRKYAIKNVTGLNILPFIRFTDPFEILAHLLVGSEGTLAFLSEVTMKTLPLAPYKASAMIYFRSIRAAAEAVVALKKDIGLKIIHAAELLDKRSLLSVDDPMLAAYSDPDLTALLTETTAASSAELQARILSISKVLDGFDILPDPITGEKVRFTEDPKEYSRFWAIRSGIFPSVGGMRRQGTTSLIEDVAFHIEDLPAATADLSDLLERHGYSDSCIYGHALEGNFHFIINQAFDSPAEVQRYADMIQDVAKLVIGKYDGSLKAEHGTGRNMAPFVRYEWGDRAFGIMQRVKALFDPEGLLNPGVIFNDDPDCYVKNFKALPVLRPWRDPSRPVEPELAETYRLLNKCIECGFCEVNCLSCGFTLSSRTRIATQREITRLHALTTPSPDDLRRLKTLEKEYSYAGEQTCAGDGLCSTSCPMGINIGELTRQLRRIGLPEGSFGYRVGTFAANHFETVKGGIRGVLRLATLGQTVLGDKWMSGFALGLHKSLRLPLWTTAMPRAYSLPKALVSAHSARETPGPAALSTHEVPDLSVPSAQSGSDTVPAPALNNKTPSEALKVVYFPSCLNQMMGLPKHPKPAGPPGDSESTCTIEKSESACVSGDSDLTGPLENSEPAEKPLVEEMVSLLQKAGYQVIFPSGMSQLCCGTIWESKGMPEIAERKIRELENALWAATEQGRYPVLCDQSPCLHRMRTKITRMKLYEPAEFILTFLRNRLDFHRTNTPVAVHLTCSTRLMEVSGAMLELARLCSSRVVVPEGVGCCGFAGDKGMTHPELNAYALRKLRDQVRGIPAGYSNSRTCEIGLTTHSGIPYRSIAYLVNRCTTAKP
jgi:D-lactate dehydrogenase